MLVMPACTRVLVRKARIVASGMSARTRVKNRICSPATRLRSWGVISWNEPSSGDFSKMMCEAVSR